MILIYFFKNNICGYIVSFAIIGLENAGFIEQTFLQVSINFVIFLIFPTQGWAGIEKWYQVLL